MSLGGFLDTTGGGGAAGARVVIDMPYATTAAMTAAAGAGFSTPANLLASLPKYNSFASAGLSLGLTNLDGSGVGLGPQGLGGGLAMRGGGGLVDFDSSPVSRNNNNNNNAQAPPPHMNPTANSIASMLGGGGGGGGGSKDQHQQTQPDGYDSRSGSDNIEGGSGDDLDGNDNPTNGSKRKRYHRHTPQQIQELEALFKECPHPDEKQRLELSKRLNLESRQVKFWFQNRRTQMKTQLERHENSILKQENDRLKAENMSYREAMRNPMCNNCGNAAMLGEVSIEEQHLRFENARLKEELERVYGLAGKFLGRPLLSSLQQQGIIGNNGGIPTSALELAVGNNNNNNAAAAGGGLPNVTSGPMVPGVSAGLVDAAGGGGGPPPTLDRMLVERSMLLEMALSAMDELVKLVQAGEPLWAATSNTASNADAAGGSGGTRETLRYDEYLRLFPRNRAAGFVAEATRQTGTVIINSAALVEIVMDEKRWADIFSCMIARAESLDEISGGVAGTRNGALKMIHAELQVLSPLVPVRSSNFLRFCKQHAEGVWAVVDVSVDAGLVRDGPAGGGGNGYMACRRLPSGFVVQDLPNGYSKVTWVEHAEYDETSVHHLYRPLLRSGLGFGASRWVSTLHRQCECLAILMASTAAAAASSNARDHASAITPAGRKSMVKLAKRMTDNFCAGVCPSTVNKWNRLCVGSVDEDVRVMTRKSVNDPGEPPGVVLSAATSVWLPTVPPGRLFDFLRDERLRSEWDILSNGGPMQEMAHIAKGQDPGNCVSLLRASATVGANQSSMLILQETCTDASGSLVVYAPVDIPAMHAVMSGGDSAYVALLPSGFAIVPDTACAAGGGLINNANRRPTVSSDDGSPPRAPVGGGGGSLLTVAFQILVNSQPTAKLTVESVETVNNLISCTVQKIKAAIQCDA